MEGANLGSPGGFSDLECTLDHNITDILSLLESPSTADKKLPRPSAVLKDVVAYVEVRTGAENRSRAVMKELALLGATLVTKFTSEVTHVVFKEGKQSTKTRADKKDVHLVSVLWVDSCKQNQCHMPEKFFGIHAEEKSTPLIGRRWKKCKSMQPKDFDEEVVSSTERSQKRRKRQQKGRLLDCPGLDGNTSSTTTPGQKPWLYVADTQPRGPRELGVFSPSLTIPDTPLNMRHKIEELRQKCGKSADSPTMEPAMHSPLCQSGTSLLQRNLFNPLLSEEPDCSPLSPKPTNASQKDSHSELLSPEEGDTPAHLEEDAHIALQRGSSVAPDSVEHASKNATQKTLAVENQRGVTRKPSCKRKLLSLKDTLDVSRLPDPTIASSTTQRKPTIFEKGKGRSRSKMGQSSSGDSNSSEKSFTFENVPERTGGEMASKQRRKFAPAIAVARKGSALQHANSQPVVSAKMVSWKAAQCGSPHHVLNSITSPTEVIEREPLGRRPLVQCNTNATRDRNRPGAAHDVAAAVVHTTAKLKTQRRSLVAKAKLPAVVMKSAERDDRDTANDPQPSVFNPESATVSCELTNNKYPHDCHSIADDDSMPSTLTNRKKGPGIGCKRKRTSATSSEDETESTAAEATWLPCGSIDDSTAYNKTILSLTKSRLSVDEFCSLQGGSRPKKKHRKDPPLPLASSCVRLGSKCSADDMVSAVPPRPPKCKSNCTRVMPIALKPCKDCEQSSNCIIDQACMKRVSTGDFYSGEMPTRTLVMTSLHSAEQEVVHSILLKLGGFHVVDVVQDNTTHVVCGEKRRTLNILNGIARGCWVVSPAWVLKSLEADRWLSEEPFEQKEFFPSAHWSRQQKAEAGADYRMQLFVDQGLIFVSPNTKPPRQDLVQLIGLCGGQVVSSMRKADVCVGSTSRASVIAVSEQWILDSITSHQCLPYAQYRLGRPQMADRQPSSS